MDYQDEYQERGDGFFLFCAIVVALILALPMIAAINSTVTP